MATVSSSAAKKSTPAKKTTAITAVDRDGKRVKVSDLDARRVWVAAGGRCTFCKEFIAEDETTGQAVFVGQLAHIVGATDEDGSPRGKSTKTLEDRARPENLMLLGYPLLFLLFGLVISRMSNLFWAELQFRSLLLDLSIEGTYTESRLSTGQSIYDSTRSENIVVRSTITPWFLLSTLLTSTFARSGNMNLEQQRHVLSFEKSDETLAAVLGELDEFFDSREAIAGVNEVDLKSASQIFQMNEQTRARSQAPGGALEQEQAAGLLRQQEGEAVVAEKLQET